MRVKRLKSEHQLLKKSNFSSSMLSVHTQEEEVKLLAIVFVSFVTAVT